MKRRVGLLWIVVWVGFAPAVRAGTPATPPPDDAAAIAAAQVRVNELVQLLTSDSFESRQAAQLDLLTMGADALMPLRRQWRAAADERASMRIAPAVYAIEDRFGIGPTRVTIEMSDAPLSRILQELAAQAKTTFAFTPADALSRNDPTLTLHEINRPFWQVLREVCRQAGFTPVRGTAAAVVLRSAAGIGDRPWANAGALMVTASTVTRTDTLRYVTAGSTSSSGSLRLEIFVDPRLLAVTGAMQMQSMLDDAGHELIQARQTSTSTVNNNMWTATVPVILPADAGTKISRGQGRITLSVPASEQKWEIENPFRAPGGASAVHKAGDLRLTLSSFARVGLNYEVTISLSARTPALERAGATQKSVQMFDTEGAPFVFVSSKVVTDPEPKLVVVFGSGTNSDPAKLSIAVSTQTTDIVLPFEIDNIPLP